MRIAGVSHIVCGKVTSPPAVTGKVAKSTGECPKGTARITATGTVVSAKGKVASIVKVGEPVSASTCVFTTKPNSGKSSLEPGTKFKI